MRGECTPFALTSVLVFLAGDDLYPHLDDPEGVREREYILKGTVEEVSRTTRRFHRYVQQGGRLVYHCNIILPHGYRISQLNVQSHM